MLDFLKPLYQRSGLSFSLLALGVAFMALQALHRAAGGAYLLPAWIVGLIAITSAIAYAHLLHRYLTRREALHRSLGEVEWRGYALARAPIATVMERSEIIAGLSRIEPSPQLEQWLNGIRLTTLDDLATHLIERDQENYRAWLTALRQPAVATKAPSIVPQLDVTLNHGQRPVRIEGQAIRKDGIVLWVTDVSQSRSTLQTAQADRATYEHEIAKLCTITEALPRPLWLRRVANQEIIWCNEAYARAMGRSREETLDGQIEFAPKSQYGAARDLACKSVEQDRIQVEERHVVVDGTRKLFRIIETPVMLEGYIVGIAFDQTELEETKAEVRLHQRSFQETLEQLATPMAIFGTDQQLQFMNQAFARLWQLEESFTKTNPSYSDLLEYLRARRKLPDVVDFQRWKRERMAMFTSLIEPAEDMMYLPDGTTIREVRIPHALGGLMFVTEDVTDKLRLESSYNTLIAVQRETLDNLSEGIAVLGSDGRLKLYNPAFARIWQIDTDALESLPHIGDMLELMRPLLDTEAENKAEDWSQYRPRLAGEMLQREPKMGRIQRANQSIVEHVSVPLPDGNVLHSFLDVSDSVRVEQALRETNKALAAADRLKSEFVANVSYQLRTPLSTIIGFAEILTNQYFGSLSERQLDYAKTILEASRKLLALINTVLDLATIEAGRLLLNRKPVAVQKLILSAVDMVETLAARQQIAVQVEPVAETQMVEVDERRISQVLFNLLVNAVQYTPPGGSIKIGGHPVLGENGTTKLFALTVSDTGIGMSADEQERVFNKFERANPQARQPGVGLGLSLVKSLVELHSGHIELESKINEGTTVTCFIPMQAGRMLSLDEAS